MRIIDNTGKSEGPYIDVVDAKYVDDYRLLITFNDGISRIVDFGDFLRACPHPDMKKYLDLEQFKKFHIDYGDLVWGDLDMIFPIMTLHQGGKIKYTRPKTAGLATKSSNGMNGHAEKKEIVNVPTPTLRRLKSLAKKEDVPLDLLVQRYLEEAMNRHRKTQRSRN